MVESVNDKTIMDGAGNMVLQSAGVADFQNVVPIWSDDSVNLVNLNEELDVETMMSSFFETIDHTHSG